MGHPDFRVEGKIFATLGPAGDWAMVHLSPASQAHWVDEEPEIFEPFSGAWGRSGCTRMHLGAARPSTARATLELAWKRITSRR